VDLVYSTLNDHLCAEVPELAFAYRQMLRDWDGEVPGPHVAFGDLLLPWLLSKLEDGDDARLRAVFDFLERLSAHPDIEVQNVVAHSIVEPGLAPSETLHRQARKYMGPALREISDHYL
jgi:hypothetical protein